ncbi:hypothetical protein [Rouxiella sp. WC2420]|uniref:Phage tail protein n=1 Tax=Rouxiella sp. WC2420 TaxID=3234145 RepID=A0AB39VL36_9GAMM
MTYQKRDITYEFTLAQGTFDDSSNTLTISNCKSELTLGAYGSSAGNQLNLKIYGLSLEYMAKLSYKGQLGLGIAQNLMKVTVNDQVLFLGTIVAAYSDFNQMPDAPLILDARATGYEQSVVCAPTFKKGPANVADMIAALAKLMGYSFSNNGVTTVEDSPHYNGSAVDQINAIAKNNGIELDMRQGSITIWPEDGARDTTKLFVSPESGLIGYPYFAMQGINFTTMFSSELIYGREVELKTDLPDASGDYIIKQGTTHYLSTWVEGGPWFTMVVAGPKIAFQGNNA